MVPRGRFPISIIMTNPKGFSEDAGPQHSTRHKNLMTGKLLFALSICLFLYWMAGKLINIYHFAFVGAVSEMLWLPMLALLFVLPVLAFIYWAKEKFMMRSLYLFSISIFITTIMLMIMLK